MTRALQLLIPALMFLTAHTAGAQERRDSIPSPTPPAPVIGDEPAAGASAPAAPGRLPRRWAFDFSLSSVYDSNLDRDDEGVDVYGIVGGARTQYRHRFADGDRTVEAEYETALHRYTQSERWNRLSHKVRAFAEDRIDSRWSVGAAAEVALKGSSEDRAVGDQYVLEPRVQYEVDGETSARLYGAYRIRKFDHAPDQDALNRYLGVEFTQEADGDREWEVGLRYEVNDAKTDRRFYNRWTWHTKHTAPLTDRDELEVELKVRRRVFPQRFIEAEDEDVPRQDQRWIPSVTWTRAMHERLGLVVQYEYEARSSNDPDSEYTGHQLRFAFVMRGY